MRFLVIGAGSIGRRHCRNLVALGQQVTVWDVDPVRLREGGMLEGVSPAASLDDVLADGPDAALICTPPVSHPELARRALDSGAHLFVEKPIADTSREIPALIQEAERRRRVLVVGFNLRFLPSLRRIKALLENKHVGRVLAARVEFGSYLPDWRPDRDYRDNYAVDAALGGGVLLDAIHEFDYLGWLFGEASEVFCAAAHVSDLAGDTEDLAESTVRYECGVLAQVHLDYLQRSYRRNLQIIGETGTIVWDYPTHRVTIHPSRGAPESESVNDGDPGEMYREELRHFLRCLDGRESPLVDGWEALRSLRVVEAARRSAAEGRWVKP
jgi:predicted dehydrogenase